MTQLKLEELARSVNRKRGAMGIRAAAQEIGVSPATLSRIENGRIPDLQTLQRICVWLGISPTSVLGTIGVAQYDDRPKVQIMFRKDHAVDKKTAKSLAALILAAHESFSREIDSEVK